MRTRHCLAVILAFAIVAPVQRSSAQSLAGEWKLDFRFVGRTSEPDAKPSPWLSFTAMVVQADSGLGATMRSSGPTGLFGCKLVGSSCSGRMRLSWDEQDWQVFTFELAPGSRTSGTGRAEIRFPDGNTDRYTFTIVKPEVAQSRP